jgi:hypothetical protein
MKKRFSEKRFLRIRIIERIPEAPGRLVAAPTLSP